MKVRNKIRFGAARKIANMNGENWFREYMRAAVIEASLKSGGGQVVKHIAVGLRADFVFVVVLGADNSA